MPNAQLTGSLGIGVDPTGDVDAQHDPGDVSTAERTCLETMQRAGQNFGTRRLAEAVGLFDCDVFRLLKASMLTGHGMNADAIIRGVQLVGRRFVPAETFSSGLGPGEFALAGSARDMGWDTTCECYRYLSSTDYPVR